MSLNETIKGLFADLVDVAKAEKEDMIKVIGQEVAKAVAASVEKITALEAAVADLTDKLAQGEQIDLAEITDLAGQAKVEIQAIAIPDVEMPAEEPVAEEPVVDPVVEPGAPVE
jgi:hypothetical protein